MMMAFHQLARAAGRFTRPIQQKNNIFFSRSFGYMGPAAAQVNKNVVVLPSSSLEGQVWRMALEDLKRTQRDEMNNLQWLKESLRLARMTPSSNTVTTSPVQTQNFQTMNRNARKPKRANKGKRPCSRVRRRWKTKSWANTSRRG